MGLIPTESDLKTLKTYLPFVCIIVLAWTTYQVSERNTKILQDRIDNETQQKVYWRDAFIKVVEAYQSLPSHVTYKDTAAAEHRHAPARSDSH